MSAVNQITIAGFAGRIAQLITKYLLNNYPEVKINGIARNISKIPNDVRSASNVTIFEADAFNKGGLLKALRGSQVAICAYLGDNTLMVDGQKFLIDACVEAGVPRYIASDWTCDYRDLVPGDMPFKDPMKAIYEYLKQKEGVEGVHMLTGAFIEVVFLRLFADEAHTKIQYFGSGDEGTDLSTMPDSAAWTAEVAVDPKAVGVINVRGDRASMKEIAQILEGEYKVKIVLEHSGSRADLKNLIQSLRQAHPDNVFAWMGLSYLHWMTSDGARLATVDNDRFPTVKPTTARDFIRKHDFESISKGY